MRRERRGRVKPCVPVNGAGDEIAALAIRAAVAALRAAVMLVGVGLPAAAMPVAIAPDVVVWRVGFVTPAMGAMVLCIHCHG